MASLSSRIVIQASKSRGIASLSSRIATQTSRYALRSPGVASLVTRSPVTPSKIYSRAYQSCARDCAGATPGPAPATSEGDASFLDIMVCMTSVVVALVLSHFLAYEVGKDLSNSDAIKTLDNKMEKFRKDVAQEIQVVDKRIDLMSRMWSCPTHSSRS